MGNLDNLVMELEEHRIRLSAVPLSQVNPNNVADHCAVKGRIAEVMVRNWLGKCQGVVFDDDLPSRVNGYTLEKRYSGIVVLEGARTLHEYDFLVFYDGRPIMVEVKSLKLNGVESKIPRAFNLYKEIFPERDNVAMLLFSPTYVNKKKYIELMERDHSQLRCVDLGYKRKQLDFAVRRFYDQFSRR